MRSTDAPIPLYPGSISGKVTEDPKDDATNDHDLESVLGILINDKNEVISMTLTNSMGAYIFNGVPPGKYIEGGNPNSIRTVAVGGDKPLTCTSSSFVEDKSRVIDGIFMKDTDNDDGGDEPVPQMKVELLL